MSNDVLNKMTVKIANLCRDAGFTAGGEVSVRSGAINTNGEITWTASFGPDNCNGHDPYTAVHNLYFKVKAKVEREMELAKNRAAALEISIRDNSL